MTLPICPREGEILAVVWSDDLRAHALACPLCAETALVAGFLREAAATPVTVPEAGLVWWKAQLRRRREAAERALRPIAIAERVCVAAAAATVVWSVIWVSGFSPQLAAGMVAGVVVLLASAGSAYFLSASKR